MSNFKPYNFNQSSMVVVDFASQIQPGTFEHAVHHLISERLDLSTFYSKYKNDSGGRSAYDPAILLRIILFAYSKGITSSREVQWCCENNIIFKALSCDTVPHFTTIASFVSSYPDALEDLFEQVLLVCSEEGLLGNELFAIDGCKMSSDASKEWSGTHKELEEKRKKIKRELRRCINEHQTLDRRKKGEKERSIRIEQSIETLDKAFDKIDRFLKTTSPRMGEAKKKKEVKSNITDNESAKMTTSKGTIQGFNGVAAVDKKHQIVVEAQAFGAGQEHHTLKPMLDGINAHYDNVGLADDIIRSGTVITADTGFSNEANDRYIKDEGINGYIPDNKFRERDPKFKHQKDTYGKRHQDTRKGIKGVIPATEFGIDIKNKTCVCPEGNEMWLHSENEDKYGKLKLCFEGKLTDCRACPRKSECMRNPESPNTRDGHGRQVSITVNTKRTATDWMKKRIDSKEGKQIYSHRMSVVEPVFGNIGTNKGLNRFSLRGKEKVQGQWRLFCIIHNIEKIKNYGKSFTMAA